jgi:hypothetical protein
VDIAGPVRELDVVESAPSLVGAVLQLPQESWREDDSRQNNYHVHNQTTSLVLLFCDGDWPDIQVAKEAAWDSLGDYAVPVMREILDKHYPRGGVILRAMAAKLPPHGGIQGHIDRHPSFTCSHRIHVPLLTNPDVIFHVAGKQITMDVGKGYEINNQSVHSVFNGGEQDRIHFIFDYVPPDFVENLPPGTG